MAKIIPFHKPEKITPVPYRDIRNFFQLVSGGLEQDTFCVKFYRYTDGILSKFTPEIIQQGEIYRLFVGQDLPCAERRQNLNLFLDKHAETARFELFPHKDCFTGSYLSDDNHHIAVTFVRADDGIVGCGWDCICAGAYKIARRMAIGLMFMLGSFNARDTELYKGAVNYLPLETVVDDDNMSDFKFLYNKYLPI